MIVLAVLLAYLLAISCQSTSGPSMFVGHMPNITVSTGREAIFTCVVDNVENFKVAFLRVDTQTILTIDETVITRSARVSVRYSIDKDERLSTRQRKTWQLSLKEVTSADAGPYMCQLNIEPMVSQVTYLHVTVPPDILVNESSSDLTVTEGDNATLKCSAIGYPEPNITWRREDYQPIFINQSSGAAPSALGGGIEGSVLNLVGILRRQMAAYLCIASNGIPPPVSKRILLRVEFAPNVTSHQVYIVQRIGEQLVLHCQCQSWPIGFTFWSHEFNRIPSDRASIDYRTQIGPAVVDMYLNIPNMQQQDQGNYTCHCSNARGTANRTISVKGLVLDPVQQRRMAHSWDAQHIEEEEEEEEENEDFSSPSARLTTATTAVSKRQTVQDRVARISTTDATTSKTIEANHATEEMKKRTIGPLLQQQQKRKESNSGVPTSYTSKGRRLAISSSLLYLLLSLIIFLIDNHPLAVAEA